MGAPLGVRSQRLGVGAAGKGNPAPRNSRVVLLICACLLCLPLKDYVPVPLSDIFPARTSSDLYTFCLQASKVKLRMNGKASAPVIRSPTKTGAATESRPPGSLQTRVAWAMARIQPTVTVSRDKITGGRNCTHLISSESASEGSAFKRFCPLPTTPHQPAGADRGLSVMALALPRRQSGPTWPSPQVSCVPWNCL